MKTALRLTIAAFLLAAFNVSAATLYVSLESTNPAAPYATWEAAATNIQDAVDAAAAGDTVLVTNGVYSVGQRTTTEPWIGEVSVNRVVVKNSVRVKSVNGPSVTTIEGSQVPDEYGRATNGIRCVVLGTNAVLSGFTLTNGYAGQGGGVAALHPLDADALGVFAVVTNCLITGNSAHVGGGALDCSLYNSSLIENLAIYDGGGASRSTLYNCTLVANRVLGQDDLWGGGGGSFCTLYNCLVARNSAYCGGGVSASTLYSCTVVRNLASGRGGGVSSGATDFSRNFPCRIYNCVVFDNVSGDDSWKNYDSWAEFHHSCAAPLPTNGVGNIDADPRFVNAAAGDFRLRPDSPCIDAGTNLSSLIQTDIEGQYRPLDGNKDGVAAFDIGAYEFRPSPMTLHVSLESTNPIPPYATWETAANVIQDAVDSAEDGDTVLVTNGVYGVGERNLYLELFDPPFHGEGNIGQSRVVITNAIRLESVNGPMVTIVQGGPLFNEYGVLTNGTRCVAIGTNAILSGFTLTNGYAVGGGVGGGVFCGSQAAVITNCILIRNSARGAAYGGGVSGGRLYNCTLRNNSTEGRCGYGGGAYLATLYGCLLEDNSAQGQDGSSGGGAHRCTLYNCLLSGNRAGRGGGVGFSTVFNCTLTGNGSDWDGGGAANSTVYNCTLTGNSAERWGGAEFESMLLNCTLTGNRAGTAGGGAFDGTLHNCIVYYNTAPKGANYFVGLTPDWAEVATQLHHCCTAPLPTNGIGNITGPPLFMDLVGGDFRLREGSPCIDAGTNLAGLLVPIQRWNEVARWWDTVLVPYDCQPTDILGNTRFIDGDGDGKVAWDIGAYEFNSFKPPRFSSPPKLTAQGWKFTLTGEPGKRVGLQRTSDFTGWWDLQPPGFVGAYGACEIIDADTGPSVMFYRAVVR